MPGSTCCPAATCWPRLATTPGWPTSRPAWSRSARPAPACRSRLSSKSAPAANEPGFPEGYPAMSGYDCAAPIQDVYVAAHNEEGRDPAFWIRYFTPSPAADIFSGDALSECRAAWDSGGHAVGCVSAPFQSRLSGSSAEGQADAQAFAASMLAAYHAVH